MLKDCPENADVDSRADPGKRTLVEIRRQVENVWRSVTSFLTKDGHHDLAVDVRQFVERMPAARTEREWIAHELTQRIRDSRVRDQHPAR